MKYWNEQAQIEQENMLVTHHILMLLNFQASCVN